MDTVTFTLSSPLKGWMLVWFEVNNNILGLVALKGHTAGFSFWFRFSFWLVPVNKGGLVMWVLSSDMEKSHGQLEMLISPLSFALALMFPTQSGFSVLTLIHAAEFTSVHIHFLPSSAEETQIIHLHINSNPPFHHLGCKKISCCTSSSPLDGGMELPLSTLVMMMDHYLHLLTWNRTEINWFNVWTRNW